MKTFQHTREPFRKAVFTLANGKMKVTVDAEVFENVTYAAIHDNDARMPNAPAVILVEVERES